MATPAYEVAEAQATTTRTHTRSSILIAAASTTVAVGLIAVAREATAQELLSYAVFFFAVQIAATSQRNQKRCSG